MSEELAVPESYGEMRLDGRHDRRIELRSTTRGPDGEKLDEGAGLLARLEMDYGHRHGNFPLDRDGAMELIGILSKFIAFADIGEARRTDPTAYEEFNKLLGIEPGD